MNIDKRKYSNLLCRLESICNYKITNQIGALGKYQFTLDTLRALQSKYGLTPFVNATNFLNNPQLQEYYFDWLVYDTLLFISNNRLENYKNKIVTGTMKFKGLSAPLNIYGMLAVAHLGGANGLKKFVESGINPNDGETSLSDYAAYFSKNLKETPAGLKNLLFAFIPAIVLYYI